jgi:hypothetical protein
MPAHRWGGSTLLNGESLLNGLPGMNVVRKELLSNPIGSGVPRIYAAAQLFSNSTLGLPWKLHTTSHQTTPCRSFSIQEVAQPSLHRWPLRHHDRIARRVASDVVGGHPMGSENPFELPADAFERGA